MSEVGLFTMPAPMLDEPDEWRITWPRYFPRFEIRPTYLLRIEHERYFAEPPPGASAVTLARRWRYGGRKGRSAARRLAALRRAALSGRVR